jgi:hypothetical protein
MTIESIREAIAAARCPDPCVSLENQDGLPIEVAEKLLAYDPETGDFLWRKSRSRVARAGDIAGSEDGQGYVVIMVNQRHYQAHRLAFLFMTGKWPVGVIDHINTIRNDNRWCNLRELSRLENGGLGGFMPLASKPVCGFVDDWVIEFSSCHSAARFIGGDSSAISKVCRGKLRKHKGWRFKYA